MIDVDAHIDERKNKLNEEFEALKKQIVNAEQFVAKGKEEMLKLNGKYAELENIKNFLNQEKKDKKENK